MELKHIYEDLKKHILPGLIISTFCILLIFLLLHINSVFSIILRILSALKYLFYGIIIAYILNQPMKLIEQQIVKHFQQRHMIYRKKRTISILLTIILFIFVIFLIASLVIPNLIESLISLISNISVFLQSVFSNIDDIFRYFNLDIRLENISSIKELINMPWQDMVSQIVTVLSKSAGGLMANATHFLSKFGTIFTGFIFSLYLLSHKETFICQLRKIIAALFGYRITTVIFEYAHKTNQVFSDFIGGQLVEACILWILYYVTMRLFSFPYPELIATIISLFSLVPVFGPITAMCVGAVLILSQDIFQAFWFIVYFQVLSQIEDNLIYPRVVGSSVGLPGIWVLLSIFAFGDLFGIFGMVIAVPTTACLYALTKDFVNKRLKKKQLKVTDTSFEKI